MSRSSATASTRSGRSRRELIALADRHGLPLVATNEPFFGRSDDYEAHDALLAIAERPPRRRDENRAPPVAASTISRRAQQMAELFRGSAGRAAGDGRDRHALRLPRPHAQSPSCRASAAAPKPTPLDEAAELRRQAEEGLEQRLAAHGPAPGLTEQDYRDRLAYEVGVISG